MTILRAMLLTVLFSGCGGTGITTADGGGMMPVVVPHNFAQIETNVFRTSCTFSVCHTAGPRAQGKLDLVTDAYAALIGVKAQNARASSEGLVLVKPCDPAHSFLMTKLELPESADDPDTGYGGHMPRSSPPLPAEQVQAISDWIARGAKQQEPTSATGTVCSIGSQP